MQRNTVQPLRTYLVASPSFWERIRSPFMKQRASRGQNTSNVNCPNHCDTSNIRLNTWAFSAGVTEIINNVHKLMTEYMV
jgi:hypothetical protein